MLKKSLNIFLTLALLAVFTIIIPNVIAKEKKLSQSQLNASLFRLVRGYGNPTRVKALLDRGADPKAKDNYGRTALMKAVDKKTASRRKLSIIKMLISAGADVNARDHLGITALMRSMIRGDETVVKILQDAGAKLSTSDKVIIAKKRSEIAARKARQVEMYKAAERFRKTRSKKNK